jgi:hypothetical protein
VAEAAAWVIDGIAVRAGEFAAVARTLPADLTSLGTDPADALPAEEVAAAFVRAPGAHLEWLLESGRYAGRTEPVATVPHARQPGAVPGPVPPAAAER